VRPRKHPEPTEPPNAVSSRNPFEKLPQHDARSVPLARSPFAYPWFAVFARQSLEIPEPGQSV
jgi:hypothetical protein